MTRNELAVIPGKPPATVTQEELRRVGELWNESEALAASIRKRLEAGASLEPGDLGVAIDAVTGPGGGGGSIFIGGIQVDAADHLRQLRIEHPELASEVWV